MVKSVRKIIFFGSILIAGFVLGFIAYHFLFISNFSPGLKKLINAYNITRNYYVDEISEDNLSQWAIEGMFNKLDPHTSYISSQNQYYIEEEFRGDFGGIGVEFRIIEDTINVLNVLPQSPSESVGLLPGDKIVKIGDKNCVGFTNSDVFKYLRGVENSEVYISIKRDGSSDLINFNITRAKIPLNSIDASFMINDSVGFISLRKFSETTTAEMIKALDTLSKKGMQSLILDLRNNPGGLLDEAYSIADLFIPDERLIVSTIGRDSLKIEELFANKNYPYEKIPLILLVDEGSASASEIVAGAVQDWDRGLIVGKPTYGKGLVQRPFILEDGSAVRITIAKYYTPSGRAIQKYDQVDNSKFQSEEFQEIDNFYHTYEIDSLKIIYFSINGRSLTSNEGIIPDYIISNDRLSDIIIQIRRKNLFYKITRKFLDNNKNKILNNYEGFEVFAQKFKFDQNDKKLFWQTISAEIDSIKKTDFIENFGQIEMFLKAFIARNLYSDNGWYYVMLEEDKIFLRAKELILKARQMLTSDLSHEK